MAGTGPRGIGGDLTRTPKLYRGARASHAQFSASPKTVVVHHLSPVTCKSAQCAEQPLTVSKQLSGERTRPRVPWSAPPLTTLRH
jgi:hypothetical protein